MKIICANNVEIYVLESFIKVCPNYQNYDVYNLMNDFNLTNYLHNEDGFAISNGYFLNGKQVTEKEMFTIKLENLINEN